MSRLPSVRYSEKAKGKAEEKEKKFFHRCEGCQAAEQLSIYQCSERRREVPLRLTANERLSRACEKDEHRLGKEMATESGVGCPAGMADALPCLELHLARYKNRITRSPADFVCGDSFCYRHRRAAGCFHREDQFAPATA
jgi:hypothetical protein